MSGRLAERDMRTLALRAHGISTDNAYGEPVAVWGAPVAIRACVQPVTSAVAAQLYGQQATGMLRALYAGIAEIRLGDGVCVGVPGDAPPDYRVAGIAQWDGHRQIDLTQRGD